MQGSVLPVVGADGQWPPAAEADLWHGLATDPLTRRMVIAPLHMETRKTSQSANPETLQTNERGKPPTKPQAPLLVVLFRQFLMS